MKEDREQYTTLTKQSRTKTYLLLNIHYSSYFHIIPLVHTDIFKKCYMHTAHSVHNTAETVGVLPQGAKATIICTLNGTIANM